MGEAENKLLSLEMQDNMQFIKGGTFQMGCTSEQKDCARDEKPAHSVTVGAFYMGKFEVTVGEFKAFVDATGYQTDAEQDKYKGSYFWSTTDMPGWEIKSGINWRHDVEGHLRPSTEYNHPVVHVSWNDAIEYCKWLSQKTGKLYRLPTEAEWEYAARGGGQAVLFGNGKSMADPKEINFDGTYEPKKSYLIKGIFRSKTVPVGSLNSPNALNLHDMSGNVWEWCSDWYDSDFYKNSPASNPTGPTSGTKHVLRGGSWFNKPQRCRVANRYGVAPGERYFYTGFRVARTN